MFGRLLTRFKLSRQVKKEKREILRKALLCHYQGKHYLLPANSVVGNFACETALEELRTDNLLTCVVSFGLDMRIILTGLGLKESLRLARRK